MKQSWRMLAQVDPLQSQVTNFVQLSSSPPNQVAADSSASSNLLISERFPTQSFSTETSLQIPVHNSEQERSSNVSQTWGERVLALIEGPWAPHPADLPRKRSPVDSGNSPNGFFQIPATRAEAFARASLVRNIERGGSRQLLSAWTSLYEYNIPLPKRLSGLDGLTVLHISDVHLLDGHAGPTSELGVIASFLEQSKRNIDLVFFTGDLITRSPNDLNDLAKNHLRRISRCAQHCFFVRGNHDFHGHTPEVVTRWLDEAGFPDYTNMCAELNRGSSRFSVCGIDDAYFGSPVAPAEVSPDFIITHNLDAIRANFPKDIFCVFSGHTHGGEAWLRPFGYLMKAWGYLDDVNRNIRGWSSLTQSTLSFVHPGQARYYVRHPGLWLPPGIAIHTFRRQD